LCTVSISTWTFTFMLKNTSSSSKEFMTLSDTHITSQPVQSVQLAALALYLMLGTRKLYSVHHALHVKFLIDWLWHVGPSIHRRLSAMVSSHYTMSLLALDDLSIRQRSKNQYVAKLFNIFCIVHMKVIIKCSICEVLWWFGEQLVGAM
jgi:hypothetical protein